MTATQTAPRSLRTREYETIYILRPTTKPEDAERCANRVAEVVAREKGKLTKVDNWGKRRLAYPVAGHSRGVFVYFKYLGQGGLVQEIERNLRQFDEIVRFQTVLLGAGPEIETVAVNPDEVKFLAVDADVGEEVLTIEQRLGLPPDRGESRMAREEFTRGDVAEEAEAPAKEEAAAADAPAGEGEPS